MTPRPNLTREDWIHAAQQVLVKGGVDAVRVDTLAKELNITRGSFYYHFKNRSELLEGILDGWRTRATEDVILHLSDAQTTPQSQLQHLMELPLHGQTAKAAAAIELAIRAWARRDEHARQAIDEVDRYRLSYIKGLLLQAGVDAQDASDRAYLIYAYQISLSLLNNSEAATKRLARNVRLTELLVPTTQSA